MGGPELVGPRGDEVPPRRPSRAERRRAARARAAMAKRRAAPRTEAELYAELERRKAEADALLPEILEDIGTMIRGARDRGWDDVVAKLEEAEAAAHAGEGAKAKALCLAAGLLAGPRAQAEAAGG